MLKARNIPETFGQLADVILKNVIDIAVYNKSQCVDFVTDRYPTVSTKNAERLHRAASGTYAVSILSDQQKVPKQWKKFMSVGSNKERLVEFLVQQWRNVRCSALQSTQLFVTNKEKCYHYSPNADAVTVEEVPELECDHEEADTKMFVHAQHAAASSDVVVIKSPDTDASVIMSLHLHVKQPFLPDSYLTQELQIIEEELISMRLPAFLDLDGAEQ